MFEHYLTLALRNIRKFGLQSLVSIIGLAAGFVALALALLWMRYENTYDAMLPDVERLYVVGTTTPDGILPHSSSQLFDEMDAWPEVEQKTFYMAPPMKMKVKGYDGDAQILLTHPSFTDIFPLVTLAGDAEAVSHAIESEAVLSESFARTLFGSENPIDKTIQLEFADGREAKVVAVVQDYGAHSSLHFDILLPGGVKSLHISTRIMYPAPVVVKLHPGKAVYDSFCEKVAHAERHWHAGDNRVIPMRGAHRYDGSSQLSDAYRRTFVIMGALLTLCALINFLTFYLNRLRGRRHEMALRQVHGARPADLFLLFAVELALVLVGATALGVISLIALKEPFAEFAHITSGGNYVMGHAALLIGGLLLVSLAVGAVAVAVARQRTLAQSIASSRRDERLFCAVSLFVQLTFGVLFLFCAAVLFLQMHHIRTHSGVATENCAYLVEYHQIDDPDNDRTLYPLDIPNRLRQLPSVEEVVEGHSPHDIIGSRCLAVIPNSMDSVEAIRFADIVDPASSVHGLVAVEGHLPHEADWHDGDFILTESLAMKLGLKNVVGTTVTLAGQTDDVITGTVVAVVKDVVGTRLRTEPLPIIFEPSHLTNVERKDYQTIYFTYKQGMRHALSQQVRKLVESEPRLKNRYELHFVSNDYRQALTKEHNLSRLLLIATLATFLIALFGIYSIITLACRQRRKEIAVRKVHGAKVGDVLGLFIKEYGLILVMAAAVAFVAGTLLMHRWLETFTNRTTLSWWLYVGLFVVVAILVALCVGTRVWKAANENPADVVKSE